jgi:hypothetical protein
MQKLIEMICHTGLTPPQSIEIDGKIHRFSSNGSKNDKAGYYCLHNNGNNFIAGFSCLAVDGHLLRLSGEKLGNKQFLVCWSTLNKKSLSIEKQGCKMNF